MQRSIHWIILFILNYLCIEGIAYSTLYFAKKIHKIKYAPVDIISDKHRNILHQLLKGESQYIIFSSVLGWTVKENGVSGLYQANSAGIRSDREYELHPSNNVLRIATFGDSFTHGDDVRNNDTWQAMLESLDARLEAINFGVGGFGLDQACLRYLEDGSRYEPDIVLIGFMSENIFRHVNTFRPFYFPDTGFPLTKPRFVINNNQELSLIHNPIGKLDKYNILLSRSKETLAEIGTNDYYYQRRYKSNIFDFSPAFRIVKLISNKFGRDYADGIVMDGYYNKESEAFRVTKKIFDYFYTAVIGNNSTPLILIFPSKTDFIQYQRQKVKQYRPLLSYLASKGYQYIDLMDAFSKVEGNYDVNDLFAVHYSPRANELVAKHILTYLRETDLGYPTRTEQK